MTTTATHNEDDKKLEELADQLESEREMSEATLDGLEARINANISALETSDIDSKMTSADNDVATIIEGAVKEDAADMETLDNELTAADAEEDKLLEDDELPPEETAAKLSPEDTGLAE